MLKYLLLYHVSLLSNYEVVAPEEKEEEEEALRVPGTIPKPEDLLPAKYEHQPFHNTCRKYFCIFRFFR